MYTGSKRVAGLCPPEGLVEGDDLSHHIVRGAIPIDEALPLARQIAEASKRHTSRRLEPTGAPSLRCPRRSTHRP